MAEVHTAWHSGHFVQKAWSFFGENREIHAKRTKFPIKVRKEL
jgi:hypothetical protein